MKHKVTKHRVWKGNENINQHTFFAFLISVNQYRKSSSIQKPQLRYLVSNVLWRGTICEKLKWKQLLFSLLITGCRQLSIEGNWDSAPPLQITAGSELTELIWAHELHQLSSRSRDLYFLPHTDANLLSLHAPKCLAVVTWANYVHLTLFFSRSLCSSSPLCWFH